MPGKTLAAGTRTLSKNRAAVTDARSENLFSISCAVNPGMSFSTINPRKPSSVIAQTTAASATLPLVIHILEPFMIQSSPSFFARVFMLPGSDPPCGSVRPKHPIASPRAIAGNQRSFCSSEP